MKKPNLLFFMTDQMQGRVLEPDHPCLTPNLSRWAEQGIRFPRAYTPNPVCSPARASLMTGLLPHNHGVLQVFHTADPDQNVLREEHPHWAQQLEKAGYRTGYFGKWHVERSNELHRFGWQVNAHPASDRFRALKEEREKEYGPRTLEHSFEISEPAGYRNSLLYGVTSQPPQARHLGIATDLALDFLGDNSDAEQPWCCFVSLTEPHDPFICGREAYNKYNPDQLELPANAFDRLQGKPGLYRKASKYTHHMTERQKKEAMACYYGAITEIDEQFGRILHKLEEDGSLENTIIIFTSDHGELLGAHGLYTKNIGAFEEVYQIPMVISGPGIPEGVTSQARVGLHDLCPTILELTGLTPFDCTNSASFTPVLRDISKESEYEQGFAEYYGGRFYITQRIVWHGSWKFVFNGFDFDELYDLQQDPGELVNLAEREEYHAVLERMYRLMWEKVSNTGDHSLYRLDYPGTRAAAFGPKC